jgi:hypothetical protein
VSEDGTFVPPKNVEITADGKVLMTVPQAGGEAKIIEVAKFSPVLSTSGLSLTQVVQVVQANPTMVSSGSINTNSVTSTSSTTTTTTNIPPTTSAAPVATGGIDLTTSVIQRSNGRLNIDVIK